MLSQRIKELRKKYRISQQELANRLKVHQSAVSNWEQNKTRPTMDNIAEVANIFGVTIEDMLGIPRTPQGAFEMYNKLAPDQQALINQMIAVYTRMNIYEANDEEG